MPVQLRSRKRTLTESESSTAMPDPIRPAIGPESIPDQVEILDHSAATLTKVIKFYSSHISKYLADYSGTSMSLTTIMYVPFLGTLGVGPHLTGVDSRPAELRGVSLSDIIKGSAYTALMMAKSRLINHHYDRQTRGMWPENLYPPQPFDNAPWFSRADAIETRVLIENGLDWCLKRQNGLGEPTVAQYAKGMWRALETALQTLTMLDCLKIHDRHQYRLFRGLRHVRYASKYHNYYSYAIDSENGIVNPITGVVGHEPTTVKASSPAGAQLQNHQSMPDAPITQSSAPDTAGNTAGNTKQIRYGHPGIAFKTIEIVRPDLKAYDDTKLGFVAIPHTMLAQNKQDD